MCCLLSEIYGKVDEVAFHSILVTFHEYTNKPSIKRKIMPIISVKILTERTEPHTNIDNWHILVANKKDRECFREIPTRKNGNVFWGQFGPWIWTMNNNKKWEKYPWRNSHWFSNSSRQQPWWTFWKHIDHSIFSIIPYFIFCTWNIILHYMWNILKLWNWK